MYMWLRDCIATAHGKHFSSSRRIGRSEMLFGGQTKGSETESKNAFQWKDGRKCVQLVFGGCLPKSAITTNTYPALKLTARAEPLKKGWLEDEMSFWGPAYFQGIC